MFARSRRAAAKPANLNIAQFGRRNTLRYRAPCGPASPRAQAKSFDPHRDKTTRRANHQNLSSPSRKNIPLSPSGKSLI
jgi:hypothetical protein